MSLLLAVAAVAAVVAAAAAAAATAAAVHVDVDVLAVAACMRLFGSCSYCFCVRPIPSLPFPSLFGLLGVQLSWASAELLQCFPP